MNRSIENRGWIWCILLAFLPSWSIAAAPKSAAERAGLPTVDSALQITEVHTPVRFPRFLASLGVGLVHQDDETVRSGLTEILASYGVAGASTLRTESPSVSGGVRMQFSRRLGLFWDYIYSGEPSTNSLSKQVACMGLVYTPIRGRTGGVAVSVASGVAFQKLQSETSYYLAVEQSGTLESISIETDNTAGIPLILMLEIPAAATSRYSLTLTARHIFAQDADVPYTGYYSSGTFKVDMSGSYLSLMLTVGI